MSRFRIRAKLAATGQTAIVKVTADDEFSAITAAAREFVAAGQPLSTLHSVKASKLDEKAKSSVYIGQMPSGKPRGKKSSTDKAEAPAANAAPAAVAGVKGATKK